MSKVLLLANYDWSNVGYEFARSLNSIGVDAEMWVWDSHAFHYYKEAKLLRTQDQLDALADEADIIQFMHSQFVRTGVDLGTKSCYVFHGGSRYRDKYKEANQTFNPYVSKSLIQTTNLMGLGAKNEVWMLPAVNTNVLKPMIHTARDKVVIGHFPGESIHKGSNRIKSVIDRLLGDLDVKDRFEYRYSDRRAEWSGNIARMADCDIYIENLNTERGAWGVTALEAAALGCVVVTNFWKEGRYLEEYSEGCGLVIANNEDDMVVRLKALIWMGSDELDYYKASARRWAEFNHGYIPTGERLVEVYGL